MAEQFAMEPGLGRFPDLVGEVASQMNELAAVMGSPPGCAIRQGDSDGFRATWKDLQKSLQSGAIECSDFSDGSGGAGSALQAFDAG
jgi:hypothetical protein